MRVLELRNVSLTYPQSRFEKKKNMIGNQYEIGIRSNPILNLPLGFIICTK